jgi:DNA repair protein RecO (recombination protein O)
MADASAGILQCEGIVLRNLRFGDTSRVATLLTREFGKIGVIAKGVRDPKSPFGASLEILAHSSFVVYYRRGRDLQFLRSGSLETEFRALVREPSRFLLGSAWLEFLDRVLMPDEPAEELFALAMRGLEILDAMPLPELPELFRALQLRAAALLGYAPRLEQCLGCGRAVPSAGGEDADEGPWRFGTAEGGAFCPECAGAPSGRARGAGPQPSSRTGEPAYADVKEAAGGIWLSPRALRRIRAMASGSERPQPVVREPRPARAPGRAWIATLDRVVEEFLRMHIDAYPGLRSLDAVSRWEEMLGRGDA